MLWVKAWRAVVRMVSATSAGRWAAAAVAAGRPSRTGAATSDGRSDGRSAR